MSARPQTHDSVGGERVREEETERGSERERERESGHVADESSDFIWLYRLVRTASKDVSDGAMKEKKKKKNVHSRFVE